MRPIKRTPEYEACFRYYNDYFPSQEWLADWKDHRAARHAEMMPQRKQRKWLYCGECGFKRCGPVAPRQESDHSFCCFTTFIPRRMVLSRRLVREEAGVRVPLPPPLPRSVDIEAMEAGVRAFSGALRQFGVAATRAMNELAVVVRASSIIIIDDATIHRLSPAEAQRNLEAFRALADEHPEWFSKPEPVQHDTPPFWAERAPNRAERRDAKFRHVAATAAAQEETRSDHFGTLPVEFGGWEQGSRYRATRSGREQTCALGKQKKGSWRKP